MVPASCVRLSIGGASKLCKTSTDVLVGTRSRVAAFAVQNDHIVAPSTQHPFRRKHSGTTSPPWVRAVNLVPMALGCSEGVPWSVRATGAIAHQWASADRSTATHYRVGAGAHPALDPGTSAPHRAIGSNRLVLFSPIRWSNPIHAAATHKLAKGLNPSRAIGRP